MDDERFRRAEQDYLILKRELDAGRITAQEFEKTLWDSTIELDGRYWALGANTGSWYVHDGRTWVEIEPPVAGSAPVAAEEPAPALPPPVEGSVRSASDRTVAAQVLRLFVLAFIGYLIFVSLRGAYYIFISLRGAGSGDVVGATISALFGLLLLGAIALGLRERRTRHRHKAQPPRDL